MAELPAIEEIARSAHKRLDDHQKEIESLRTAKHDIYEKIHTHAGIMVGMQGAVETLTTSVNIWSEKTDKNTKTMDEGKVAFKTATVAFKIGFTILCVLGSAFASFIIFVGGTILKWW